MSYEAAGEERDEVATPAAPPPDGEPPEPDGEV